jgi:hypothetical protein
MPKAIELVELARIWRGPVVESTHSGVVAVANTAGTLRHAWGDPGWAPTPRSALKPFQAVALVESGAADAFGLTDEHIAMACASHHAEPAQVALVRDWLGKLGLGEDALICGPARRVYAQGAGTLDGPRGDSGTTRGTATVATALTLADGLASFPASGLVGSPVVVVEGRGKGQRIEDAGFDEYAVWHAGHTEDKGSRYGNPTVYTSGALQKNLTGQYGDDLFADFIQKFDALCDRLGYNRSEVARYCLKKFFNEHFNNPENFKRVRNEMF